MKRRSFLQLTAVSAMSTPLPLQSSPEIIVIGAGAFGGWTAFYLREMGARVTLLDAYGPGNARASSGGETRLLRADYGAQELYTKLALRAFPLWKRWQEEFGAQMFLPSGRLLMARAEGMANLKERQARLAKHNFKTEILLHDELKYRWPQINYEDIAGGIYDTASGILKARAACRVVAEQFQKRGGTMKIAQAKPGAAANGEMQGLQLANGETLRASLYVFACGPWLRKVFPALLGKRLRTPRRDVFFIGTPPGDDRFSWHRMPSWGFGGPSNEPEFGKWYGFPDVDERGLKACPVDDANQIDPDTDERIVSAYQLKRAHDYLGWRFPALRNQPITETRVCQTENTIDDNFIVTPHPEMKNVWIVGGGSGHGFKHGPAFGQYLANRLLGKGSEPEFDQAFTLKKKPFDCAMKSVIIRLAANEIRHSLRNRSLPIACVSVAALLLLSAIIAQQNQSRLNAQRNEYQQRVRSNWLEQPDRHPHRASHYGYLAFRPKAPLSFFDTGVDSFAGTSVYLEAHRQNTANFSEANHSGGMLRFGELSPALVLQLLVPLAIFFLGFAAITGERENGTLPMLLAQGVTWRELIVGKTLGLTAMAVGVTAPGALLLLVWRLFVGSEFAADTLWRALALLAGYSLYLLICTAFTVLVSAWQQTSRTALTSLILCWIVLFVVIPRGAQTLGAALAPAPAKAEFDARLENELAKEGDSHDPNDPHFASLRAETLKKHNVANIKDLPFNYGAFVMLEAEKISSDIFRRYYGELLATFRRQNRVSEWGSILNPYLAMRSLSSALAGSNLAHYAEFQWQAESFRYGMVQKLNQLHMDEIKFENDRAQRVSHQRWQEFPAFEFRAPTIGWALQQQALSIVSLLGWSVLLLLLVWRIKPGIGK